MLRQGPWEHVICSLVVCDACRHKRWLSRSVFPVLGTYRLRYAPPLPPSNDTLDSADWTSKACLLNAFKCGESWGVDGRKGKVFRFFVCTFPQFLCSLEFSFLFHLYPEYERTQCSWASGLLVQQPAYMCDTRNFNFRQTLEGKTLMCAFFYTEYLLCAMFTDSLNCVSDLICFHNTG